MDNWLLTFTEFSDKVKAIRHPQYYEDYYRLGKKHLTGYHYYLYIDENLNVINPYTKKDQNKKSIAHFISTCSREDVLLQAYNFILIYANDNGLFDENVCDIEIIERQINYLENIKST